MIVSLFKCRKRNIPRFVHQCSSSGPLQNAWLCLSEFGSGKSECPPGPEGNGTVINEVPWMSSKKLSNLESLNKSPEARGAVSQSLLLDWLFAAHGLSLSLRKMRRNTEFMIFSTFLSAG